MLSSALFFLCVALNAGLIWVYLSRRVGAGIGRLVAALSRTRLYFKSPLTPLREQALRRRTGLLLRQLAAVILGLAVIVILYLPSMLFAIYRSNLADAFVSLEALAAMIAAAAAIGWRRRVA